MSFANNILIVDDHIPTSKSLEKLLRTRLENVTIVVRNTLEDALAAIKATDFDAVITDWRLDDDDSSRTGFSVVKAARAKDHNCITIVLSAYPEEIETYRDFYKAASFDFVQKSVRGINTGDQVCIKIQSALERREIFLRADAYARHLDHKLRDKYGRSLPESFLQSKWLTIMFADIRKFSIVASRLKAHRREVSELLRDFYTIVINCAHQHGGMVDKLIGDGVMILFGIMEPTERDDASDAISAVKAAIDIQRECQQLITRFRELAARLDAVMPSELGIGIGINRGEELVGIIRTTHRDQFTAVGHGVNLAQRLEIAACKEVNSQVYGSILISSPVESLVRDRFVLRQEPPLGALFGSSEIHPVWSVTEESSVQATDNQSLEQILSGEVKLICGQAKQIYRDISMFDHGIDGEIEFKDDLGNATGHRLYLQLKSGDSYLRTRRKDGVNIFRIKNPRWATYWQQHAYPVMLVIRTSSGEVRWMNVSDYLKSRNLDKQVIKQIEFVGEILDVGSILQMRETALGAKL